MSGLPPAEPEEDEAEPPPDFLSTPPVEGIDSASDERSLRRKTKRSRQQQTNTETFWRAVLADETGRAVVWGLLQKWATFANPSGVTPTGFPDLMTTGFHLGRQSAGRELYNLLATIDRAAVLRMHDEHDPAYIAAVQAKTKTRIIR